MTQTLPDFKIGEIVDISIKGGRVISDDGHGLGVAYELTTGGVGAVFLPPDGIGIAVEKVASAAWPPQPGDLWRSENPEHLWFARKHQCGDVDCHARMELVNETGYESYTLGRAVPVALQPLYLICREGAGVPS